MKLFLKFLFTLVFGIGFFQLTYAQTTISSISPSSGSSGTVITITGTNFNTTAANNVVYFGAVKASTPSAATSTSLTVTVPLGAAYGPITVLNTATGLQAQSSTYFSPNHGGNKSTIVESDFVKTNVSSGTPNIWSMPSERSDLDGDGDIDLIMNNYNSTTAGLLIFSNTSTVGSVSIGSSIGYPVSAVVRGLVTGDLDGDGKQDIVGVGDYNGVSIWRNTSTSGSISLATRIDLSMTNSGNDVALGDIDGDGKLDIVVTNNYSSNVAVFLNTSTSGSISFAAQVNLAAPSSVWGVKIGDINGDGKNDIVTANVNSSACVSMFRNTGSSTGTVSFGTRADFTNGTIGGKWVELADMDLDGVLDLVVSNNDWIVSVFRNTSSGNTLSLGTPVSSNYNWIVDRINIGDLNGDGKPDVIIPRGGMVAILRNTSTSGSISLTGQFEMGASSGGGMQSIEVVDLDLDGKLDMFNGADNTKIDFYRYNPPSTNANLSALTISVGSLSPTFASSTTSYTASVSNATTSVTVTPTKADANATITVNTVAVASGSASGAIALSVGSNTITVVVTAQDGTTTKTYTITVTRAAGPTTYYVKPTSSGTGTGASWANASSDLQAIINGSSSGDEIWVAAGTYIPSRDYSGSASPGDARTKAFTLKNGVKLYGGFNGTETLLTQRNASTNVTILSGEIGTAAVTDNVYHVVLGINLTNTTVFDGFTVRDGYANGGSATYGGNSVNHTFGGGLFNGNCTYTVSNIIFRNNYGNEGAALVNSQAEGISPTPTVTVNDCKFISNTSNNNAAALYTHASICNINRCVFDSNTGGGIAAFPFGNFVVDRSVFVSNTSTAGGAARMRKGSMLLKNCVFANNSATNGGAVFVVDENSESSSNIFNCTFYNNTATADGSAFWGAGSYIVNSIFNNNTGGTYVVQGRNQSSIEYSLIAASSINQTSSSSLVSGAPSFVNTGDLDGTDNVWGTSDDGLVLGSSSAAYNAGVNTQVQTPTLDLLGNARIQFTTVDLGAYESTTNLTVSNNANLSALTISSGSLSPTFASGTTSYTASVSNATTSVTVTPTKADANATITVNTVAVASGSASGAIALSVGLNTITVVVTAQDGTTTKTYTITVTRAASTNADLSALTTTAGSLSPTFASSTTSYTASVSNATTSVTVTPTKADANATITVNTVAVASGSASGAIALSVGSNTITVVVTAQDGTTTKTYTITVTRAAGPTTYYVKPTSSGTGTGASWANASSDLQAIINGSSSGDEIWVAAGTYVPSRDATGNASPSNARSKTFLLKDGVKMYGGFNGTETLLTQRNFNTNVTILSGDLGTTSVNTDNAYHVIIASNLTSATIFSGFKVVDGNANAGGSITVSGNPVENGKGGGVHSANSTLTFDNIKFENNSCDASYGGGAIYGSRSGTLTFNNCVFTNNSSLTASGGFGWGGAYASFDPSPYSTNAIFSKCVFANNTGASGGAIFMRRGVATISNCIFTGNTATNGGAVYIYRENNESVGAITHSTFYNNSASTQGKSFWGASGSTVQNSIFYNNTGAATFDVFGDGQGVNGAASVVYCVLPSSNVSSGTSTSNNVSGDPKFVNVSNLIGNDGIWGTADDGLMLGLGSVAFNAGSNSYAQATDIVGTSRPQFTTVDMGAYESTTNLIVPTWTGSTNTDWNTASNWSPAAVPTATDAAIIPLTANQPNNTGSVTIQSLSVASGVTITNSGSIAVTGSLTNNGTIQGQLQLTGTSNQSINGTGTIQNLVLNNAAGATISSGMTSITNQYTPTSGLLTTNGFLTLASSATGTSRVAAGTGTYISGNVTVQRYIPGGRRAYRFLSHPFSSSLALSSITDNIDVTGTGGSPMTTTGSNAPSAFSYDNSVANSSLSSDPGWTGLTASSVFNARTGYRILVRGSKGQAGSLTGGTYTPDPVTLDWTGALNQGNQVVTLANNGTNRDYTLVGNPYASPVDLSLITRGSNINANFSVWNANAGTRGAYVTQAFSSSYILPSGGAFFTQSAGNTNNTITFTEASKSSGTPTSLFRNTTSDETLTIEVQDVNGNYADQLGFFFNSNNKNYTANNDAVWDAIKMTNPEVNFYSFSKDNTKLAIDRRPATEESIALGFTAAAGNYSFVVKDLPSTNEYYLKDNYLGTSTLLSSNTIINFAVNTDAASYGNSRFELARKTKLPVLPSLTPSFIVTASPNPVTAVLNVTYAGLDEQESSSIVLVSAEGKTVRNIALGKVQAGKQSIDVQSIANGVYTVQLVNGVNRQSIKIVKQ